MKTFLGLRMRPRAEYKKIVERLENALRAFMLEKGIKDFDMDMDDSMVWAVWSAEDGVCRRILCAMVNTSAVCSPMFVDPKDRFDFEVSPEIAHSKDASCLMITVHGWVDYILKGRTCDYSVYASRFATTAYIALDRALRAPIEFHKIILSDFEKAYDTVVALRETDFYQVSARRVSEK